MMRQENKELKDIIERKLANHGNELQTKLQSNLKDLLHERKVLKTKARGEFDRQPTNEQEEAGATCDNEFLLNTFSELKNIGQCYIEQLEQQV